MKPHLVLRLADRISSPPDSVPDWQTFIRDKSTIVETLEPNFDAAMHSRGLEFWLTREFAPAGDRWSQDEMRAGLDRVFRVILQREANLPPGFVDQIRLNPAFDYVRVIDVSESRAPETVRATSQTQFTLDKSRERIGLNAAHLFGKGDRRIKVAVLDTGVDIRHPELAHAIEAQADFVSLDGLDTTDFIGDISG